jgi:hypothetical protein
MTTRGQVRPIVTAVTVHRLSPALFLADRAHYGDSNECGWGRLEGTDDCTG